MDGSYGKTMGPLSLMLISWPWPCIPSVHKLWPQHTCYIKIKKNKICIKHFILTLDIIFQIGLKGWYLEKISFSTFWKLTEDTDLLLSREYLYFLAIFFPSLTIRYTYRRNHHGQFPVSHWPIRYKDHCSAPGTTDGLDVKKGPGCKLLQMLVVFLVIVKRVD